jgi:hypothetical protein
MAEHAKVTKIIHPDGEPGGRSGCALAIAPSRMDVLLMTGRGITQALNPWSKRG